MNAAIKQKEGESTPYDDDGDRCFQLNFAVEIQEGDEVKVYYEKDSAWYTAVVTNVTQYKDDVRYNVKFRLICVWIRFVS